MSRQLTPCVSLAFEPQFSLLFSGGGQCVAAGPNVDFFRGHVPP